MPQVSSQDWQPSLNYTVHKCEYCPKDYAVLIWPEEDVACVAKVYENLPDEYQTMGTVYEYLTLPSKQGTIGWCPWCGEEVLKDDNYEA